MRTLLDQLGKNLLGKVLPPAGQRGPTFREAMSDLLVLPEAAWERQATLPVLIAFRMEIPRIPWRRKRC